MRLRYYRHGFLEVSSNKHYRHPIEKILDSFCKVSDSDFKNKFSHNGESIFLLRKAKNCYLFIKTKDTDIIQAIDRKKITSEEIEKRLKANESIGFVSFIYVSGPIISFCSTHLGPTTTAFVHLINNVLFTQKIDSFRFYVEPLEAQIDRKEARKLKFIGSASIRVNDSNSLFDDICSVFDIDNNNANYLDSFEIKIIPKRNKNIQLINNKLLQIDNTGMEKYEIRAKAELHERLTEYRIESSLIMRDDITIQSNQDIYTEMAKSTDSNKAAIKKALENEKENDVKTSSINAFSKLHTHSNWDISSGDTKNSN